MSNRSQANPDRARLLLAQEAARIIVEHGIEDFRMAKHKAAERLGMASRGALPGNSEIESAITEHLRLFGADQHRELMQSLRKTALVAMSMLEDFTPRLVGPVLQGTAAAHSAVQLHLFADTPELVASVLQQQRIQYKIFERRLRTGRDKLESYAGYRFLVDEINVEATVFVVDELRQAPLSPIDGKPMRRADAGAVRALLELC